MQRLLCLVLLVAGCGGGGGSSPDLASLSADQACADAAAASCAKLDACHVKGVALRYGDMATCVARTKANCLGSLGAPDTGRTPANEEACAAAYAGATCTDYNSATIAACQPPPGTRPPQSPCTFAAQCDSGFCAFAPGAKCGTCTPPPAIGASCAQTQCAAGQVCAKATTTCQALGIAGASCSANVECQVGLSCVSPTNAGNCQAAGEMATVACDRTSGPPCDYLQGLYCSFAPMMTAGSCVDFLYAIPGQACGFLAGTGTSGSSYTLCIGSSDCIIPTGMFAGTCVGYAAEGGACDTAAGPFCLTPARCVTQGGTSGTCALPDPTQC